MNRIEFPRRPPTAEQQAAGLIDIAHGLQSQLERLSCDPSPWSCELMASNLEGARRAVLRLRECLISQSSPPEAA